MYSGINFKVGGLFMYCFALRGGSLSSHFAKWRTKCYTPIFVSFYEHFFV